MSYRKLLSAAGFSVAMALAGSAFAQAGTGASGTMPSTMPPDTTTPNDSARRMSPTAGSSTDIKGQTPSNDSGATNADGKSTSSTHKKHVKKNQPQPKPADNDNNATPNTISPSSTPSPQ
ncbi:MAG: hypothetical protein JWR07_300 [Nevskia sp.]|nr:hypothetical protein [Nevskia sp.]